MSYISFENVTKKFDNTTVLDQISLQIEEGKLVTLLGPSGCGKSTLLRCLAGLEQVSSGNIILNGVDITHKEPKDREIGMVFQQYSLFPNMNIYQNVAFGLKMKKVPEDLIREKVAEVLKMVDLQGRENAMPKELSGGQQQRVALARSIVTNPKVLLLDEPFSAIDAKLRKSLQMEIRSIQQELGITTVFVTHDQDEAMIMSDEIHLLNKGKVEQSDTPINLYTKPKTPFAAGFIGNYNIFAKKEFQCLVGNVESCGNQVAIRPETVETSSRFVPQEDAYQFAAQVMEASNRGNVIRYTVRSRGITLQLDTLFRSKGLYDIGDEIYITIKRHNCIHFQ